jgi:hypothetical protein
MAWVVFPGQLICRREYTENELRPEATVQRDNEGIKAMDRTRTESAKDPTWFIPPIVIPGLLIALLIAIVAYHAYS